MFTSITITHWQKLESDFTVYHQSSGGGACIY